MTPKAKAEFVKRMAAARAKSAAGKRNPAQKTKRRAIAATKPKSKRKTNTAGKARKKRRSNPGGAAEIELYERFHGRGVDREYEVTERISAPEKLSGIGKLISLTIRSIDGSGNIELRFKGVLLSQDKKAKQLYVRGGDQSVNLREFGIDSPHDLETLGEILDIVYFTQKDHLMPEDGGRGEYIHQFAKDRQGKRHVKIEGGRYPDAIYDVRNKLISIAGGTYSIEDEGIKG